MPVWRQLPGWVTALIVICCVIELGIELLWLTGFGNARPVAMIYGAFWSGLLGDVQPAYAGQPILMFLTYGLLHGGLIHLAMNMVSLVVVARPLATMISPLQMGAIYLVSQIAAAALFGVMSPDAGPMVGASGAIFGVAAALIAIVALRRSRRGQPMRPLWQAVANIVLLNLGLTFLVPGIAWQAHLGGAAAGLVMGLMMGGGRRR